MPSVRTGFKALPVADLRTSFERADEYGFDFLEVPLHPLEECREIRRQSDDVVAAAEETNVDVVAHLPHKPRDEVCVGSADDRRRKRALEEVRGAVETASDLGASTAVLHVEAPETHLADADEALLFDVLESLSEFARSNDVELCYENLSRRYPTLDDFPRLLECTTVSLTVDTGHARVNGYTSAEIAAFAADHADRISHVHLNDTRGPEDEHLPFGAGTIDFDLLLGSLRDAGWSGTLTTEVKTHDFDYIRLGKEKLDELI
ncbi:sugar phosphate isomerase/epimerase family protein [Natrarchaeobius oligotrophus]|uniref:Sugar phosphate isomerase/epimerase n=1 Tax=Natrarchaeobius chitinivorans TaxID=1679083 RepID=A0A3N6MFC1_NATCH|nr:sugar phosphate isomerase/epimerase family protein [Natrarchaeobius chitinivorans]RQH02649.1 sugar phosphate isomerase/epimerase [Natrarchaeobius chitinivorans]